MAHAPFSLQSIPDRLQRSSTTVSQPASIAPEPRHGDSMCISAGRVHRSWSWIAQLTPCAPPSALVGRPVPLLTALEPVLATRRRSHTSGSTCRSLRCRLARQRVPILHSGLARSLRRIGVGCPPPSNSASAAAFGRAPLCAPHCAPLA